MFRNVKLQQLQCTTKKVSKGHTSVQPIINSSIFWCLLCDNWNKIMIPQSAIMCHKMIYVCIWKTKTTFGQLPIQFTFLLFSSLSNFPSVILFLKYRDFPSVPFNW